MRQEYITRVARDLLRTPFLLYRKIRLKIAHTPTDGEGRKVPQLYIEITRIISEEGPLRIVEISKRLEIAKAQMTQIVDRMEMMDLIERQTDPKDRRAVNLKLTRYGEKFILEREQEVIEALIDDLSHLSEAELTDIGQSLNKLQKIIGQLNS
jgi:DNA-binding MarR family transcriptional regulator